MSKEEPPISPAPQDPDRDTESPAASTPGLPLKPRPVLDRVMKDISTSLQELQAYVQEAQSQPEAEAPLAADQPRASLEHYRDLFELAPDAYLVTDPQMIIQEANQAAAALLQLSQAALPGQTLSSLIFSEDRAAFQAGLILLREGREKRDWELRLQAGAGPPVAVSINVKIQTDHHDNTVRLLWLLRDARTAREAVDTLQSLLGQIKGCFDGTVAAFAAAVEKKDPQTAGHQRRVAQLAVAIGREMEFSLNHLEGIKIAGMLHDVGKIVIPSEILSKPGDISPLECEFIKSHCQAGYELLQPIPFPWPVAQAVLQHHERLDGSGYPAGLTGADIILEARILGVADVVEAMTCSRSYGPAQGIAQALEEVRKKAGTLYDPVVVNICLKLFVEKGFDFA